ncbi:C4-dicarboxylate ABC transporter substrate-binding protein [Desulfosporosinus sp. HMP52]|uniref:TRAP transporter substrate-binding protein n=1 Tax=Desulfosporosinus sp. HMP52 TaxID=1487923 RepID=UPI00051FA35C|nr:DctP family TRAP transporter solute-binding subunit [Desulfosporosinus sp. HMP52]KGK82248.1 C4-dicarboxylate ABC transporter substrate-binding protein [Desulfosporosinus sp. HMP52]
MMKFARKPAKLLAAALCIGLLATGCSSGGSKQASSSDGKEVIEIKLAHASPAVNDRLEIAAQAFKKYVEEKSSGKLKVTTYPDSQLGAEREELEGIQLGSIQMGALSSGPLPGVFPKIMVFDLPYLFSTQKAAYEVLDGPVGKEILDLMKAETGVRGLAWGENGFRHFTNSVRPIKQPSDMQGLKIRTMENPAHMAIVKSLGGSPTPMPFNEVYTGLQQKTIDGQENPLSLIVSMRFYEAQKYLTLDGHVYNPYILMINDDFYNGLSDDLKKIVDEGSLIWQKVEREENNKQVNAGLEKLKAEGLEITELSLEQHKAFRDASKSVYETIGKKEVGEELLNKVVKAVEEAESKK